MLSAQSDLVEEVACAYCGSQSKEKILEKNLLRIVRCPDCGLWYTDRRWNAQGIAAYYQEAYFNGGVDGAFKDYRSESAEKQVDFSHKFLALTALKKGGKLLDVGCATGVSLAAAAKAGYEPEGLELSAWAVAHNATPYPIHHCAFTDFNAPGRYDVITLWDVLEHVADPDAVFAKLHALLNPGGLAVVSYPDPGTWMARMMGAHWWVLVPDEHLYFYPAPLLCAWMQRHGFRFLRQNHEIRHLTLAKLMQKTFPAAERLLTPWGWGSRLIRLSIPYKHVAVFQKSDV